MVFTFFKALGHEVGDSYVEWSSLDTAREIIQRAADGNVVIRFATDIEMVPTSCLIKRHPKKFSSLQAIPEAEFSKRCMKYNEMLPNWAGVDIGPQSISDFETELYSCKTVMMNGKVCQSS